MTEEELARVAAKVAEETEKKKAEAAAKKKEAETKAGCGCLAVVAGVFVVALIFAMIFGEENEGTTVGDDPTLRAGIWCEDDIERLAQYGVRWTDGFMEPKFARYRWENDEQTIAYTIGDEVEFQNGFGAWQRHWYACEIDFSTDPPTIIEVVAFPGSMPGR